MEKDLIYPLLRGTDVARWEASSSLSILLTHEKGQRLKAIPEIRMEKDYLKVFKYLKRFKDFLEKRPAFKRYFRDNAPFYSVFNIGDYTFAPWKVVWREQASGITASVIGLIDSQPVIPDHKLMLVQVSTAREAHYLCAVLNSAPSPSAISAYAIETQIGTHILENIAIPKYS